MSLHHTGGTLIGRGEYGAVFQPPIACRDQRRSPASSMRVVGKVFKDAKEFSSEKAVMDDVVSQPSFASFALNYVRSCKIGQPSPEDLAGLPASTSPSPGSDQLIYSYGGRDLHATCKRARNTSLAERVRLFVAVFASLQDIMEGLVIMKRHNVIHNDIKPSNILFHEKKQVSRLIDWGLMDRSMDTAYVRMVQNAASSQRRSMVQNAASSQRRSSEKSGSSLDIVVKSHPYPYYPVEYRIAAAMASSESRVSPNNLLSQVPALTLLDFLRQQVSDADPATFLFSFLDIDCDAELALLKQRLGAHPSARQVLHNLQQYADRIDVYSMGMTLAEVMRQLHLLTPPDTDLRVHAIRGFVRGMVRLDPAQRFTPEQALQRYQEVLTLIRKRVGQSPLQASFVRESPKPKN